METSGSTARQVHVEASLSTQTEVKYGAHAFPGDRAAPAESAPPGGGTGYGLTGMSERAGGAARRHPGRRANSRGLPCRALGSGMSEVVRVLVADDQRVVREGLGTLLGLLEGVEVVGTVGDGEEAVRLAAELRPDVVLMDLRMPRCDGVEATRRLRAEDPSIAVLVLTTYADDRSVIDALRAGARGYLTKDAGAAEIQQALRQLKEGQAVIDPAVQHHLLDAILKSPAADGGDSVYVLPDGLTVREAEVLRLMAQGLSNAHIVDQLFVNQSTVKTHINHLFAKTGVRDRAQAVTYAYQHGLT